MGCKWRISTSWAAMKVSCEPSSVSRLAEWEARWEETLALAVLRKTKGSTSVDMGFFVFGDALVCRQPLWGVLGFGWEPEAALSLWRLVWCCWLQCWHRKRLGQSFKLACPMWRHLVQQQLLHFDDSCPFFRCLKQGASRRRMIFSTKWIFLLSYCLGRLCWSEKNLL